jgi:hypothetical protein
MFAATLTTREIGQRWKRSAAGGSSTEYSMLDLIAQAASSPLLPLGDDFAEFDAECGVGGTDTAIRCGAPPPPLPSEGPSTTI